MEVERSKTTLISPIYTFGVNEGSEEWKFNQRLNPFSIENKVIRRHWVLRIIKSFTHMGFLIFTNMSKKLKEISNVTYLTVCIHMNVI